MIRPRGHDPQIAAFRAAMTQGRMHHAWLLAGPRGLGKAMFAMIAAHTYLDDADDFAIHSDGRTARLIAAESHPDFMLLERAEKRDKTGEKTGDRGRNIGVDQVRGLQKLFATTPTFSSRRAIIIDSVDDMERNAANALLKNLEEPPSDTLFLLVSHSPGKLLPTIRSRCRMLRFQPLPDDEMVAVLRAQLPDIGDTELAALIRAGQGAPGRALGFAGLAIDELDAAMDRLVEDGDRDNAIRSALARSLAGKTAQARYEAFLERLPPRIAAQARRVDGARRASAIEAWATARTIAETAVHRSLDPQTTVFELAGMLAALAPERRGAKA